MSVVSMCNLHAVNSCKVSRPEAFRQDLSFFQPDVVRRFPALHFPSTLVGYVPSL